MSAITLTRVEKRYGAATALKPTDLSVQEGEFMTLLGPSGSGKTTLLNIVAGITSSTGGQVHFGDVEVSALSTRERNLGMVFQGYALMPHMTVFDNVAFPLQVRGMSRAEIERRVMESLELVSMQAFAGRRPRELSGGQQQRVSIARCLVYRPSIVLMDEPLGALDKKLRAQLQAEIKRLHREVGFTALYVTHDQEEALSLSDRICLMHDGGVVQVSPPAQMYFQPQSILAADFIGESNLFDAVVMHSGAATALQALGTQVAGQRSELPAGARVTVLLRPESLRLLRAGDGAPNVAAGTVADRLFLGDHVRITLRMQDGTRLTLKQSSADAAAAPSLEDSVLVGWESDNAILLAGRA